MNVTSEVIDTAKRDKLPKRNGREKPISSFETTVKGSAITSVRFSGTLPGGYLVCDEVRHTPSPKPEKCPRYFTSRNKSGANT